MSHNNIIKIDPLDVFFVGRNKDYGAYDLRKTYYKRLLIAISIAMAVIFGAFIASFITKKLTDNTGANQIQVRDVSLAEPFKKEEPPPPPPPPPPKLPPLPQVATIAFTPPKIVKDAEVMKPPPEVKEIEEAKVDVKTVAGTKDLGIIAPPVENKGTQVVAAPVERKEDEDKIFTKVEIEASFPGGPDKWLAYVKNAISSHLDEFTESDYGTCIVKFVVDKTGKVSNVEATTMKGSKLAEIATNIIRKGPNWVPAQQNGKYVNAIRLQPVTLQNPDQ